MWRTSIIVVFLYCSTHLICAQRYTQEQKMSRYSSVVNTTSYDKRVRPDSDGAPTVVRLEMTIQSLSVDESTTPATVNLQSSLRSTWRDPRLTLQLSGASINTSVQVPTSADIWTPDLFTVNAVGPMTSLSGQEVTRIYNNGNVLNIKMVKVGFMCIMERANYPFDQQECDFGLELYGHSHDEVQLEWKSAVMAAGLENHIETFEITETEASSTESGDQQRLSLKFHLRRRSAFYTTHVHAPTIITVVLSWLAFLINHQKVLPLRITIGVITLLAMMYIGMGIGLFHPRQAYASSIDIWMGVCFLFVLAAFVQLILLVFLTGCLAKRDRARVMRPTTDGGAAAAGQEEGQQPPPPPKRVDRVPLHRIIDALCLIIFIIAFIVFNIIYWPAYMA